MYRSLPERIKHWYKTKGLIDQKINVKVQTNIPHSKVKSAIPVVPSLTHRKIGKRITPENKGHLPTITTVTSSKRPSERKESLSKSRTIISQEKERSNILDDTSAKINEKKKIKSRSQIPLTIQVKRIQTKRSFSYY